MVRLFLCLVLRTRPLESEGVVIGLGPQSFTVFVPLLDLEERLHAKQLHAAPEWDHDKQVGTRWTWW